MGCGQKLLLMAAGLPIYPLGSAMRRELGVQGCTREHRGRTRTPSTAARRDAMQRQATKPTPDRLQAQSPRGLTRASLLLVAAALSGCVSAPFADPFTADAGADSEADASKPARQMMPAATGDTPASNGGSVKDDEQPPAAMGGSGDKGFAGGDDYDGPVLAQPSRGAASRSRKTRRAWSW